MYKEQRTTDPALLPNIPRISPCASTFTLVTKEVKSVILNALQNQGTLELVSCLVQKRSNFSFPKHKPAVGHSDNEIVSFPAAFNRL
jgi:hypothetical protein